MSRPKKDIIFPKLKPTNGDMSTDWYVEYSIRNQLTGKMERKRIYDGFKELDTISERKNYADELIRKITEQIKLGEINTSIMVEYEDELLFNTSSQKYRKRLGPEFSFRVLASTFIISKKSEVNNNTIQTYKSKLRIFSEYLSKNKLENKNITLVKNIHIINFLDEITNENNLSRSSVDKYQQILHTFFKWVIERQRILMENPVLNIPRFGMVVDEAAPAIPKKVRSILREKIEKEDRQLWLNISFQYYCAIRPAELRLMKIKQINFDSQVVTIYNFLSKNNRTETIDIPNQLMRMIRDLKLHEFDQGLYVFGENGEPGPKPVGKNAMRNRFNRLRDELHLTKEIKLYSWKHSGAMELKESGADMYQIQRHFRHKSVTTTERYWVKRLGGTSQKIKENFPDI